ncbi:MAG: efflux RND transporter periplasmic adaptor subunit [Candidatus Eiseniibacteriota bacterium]
MIQPRSMRRLRLLGQVSAAILVVAGVSSCSRTEKGQQQNRGTSSRVGSYQISVENRPARPRVGENTILIAVGDSTGRPLGGAEVRVLIAMAAMGVMPRMESGGVVREVQPGLYEAEYGLAMAGEWNLSLTVRTPDRGEAQAAFTLSTSTQEYPFLSGTPPSGGTNGVGELGADGSGVVSLDPERRQAIGVRTARVTLRRLQTTIRAAGKVAYDETRRAEISLKFSGWVREIDVDYTGQVVRAGMPLFSVYSPELLTAQQEYLEALHAASSAAGMSGARDPDLAAAARQRLLLWDVAPAQIDEIMQSGKPMEAVPILAPAGGVVVEKNVVQGSAFSSGQMLYKIAPVDPVWVVASVYQHELPLVREGMGATVLTPFLGEQSRRGRVAYINPYLDPQTRTGDVRLQVPNPHGDLKPGMFVDVVLERDLGERLAVPESAVIYAGDRRVVFVDLGDSRLAPRNVSLGPKAGEYYEVLGGLKAGEIVVTSGNFLIAAESKLKAAAQKF